MVRNFLSAIFLALFAFTPLASSYAGGDNPPDVEIKTTRDLKQYMYKFGSMLAGIELLRAKEKKIDWEAIHITLVEMNKTLEAMQAADKSNAYKNFTDQLTAQLIELKRLSEKKSPQIYDSFDKLTNTCFQCHAAHRPADFLKPDPNRRLSQESK
jgi:hypothetical protein